MPGKHLPIRERPGRSEMSIARKPKRSAVKRVSVRRGREQALGNSRAAILGAAARLFAEKPYEDVNIRDVGKAAKVGSPTIYHFFQSKKGLYQAAVLDLYSKRAQSMAALLLKTGSARQRFRSFITAHLESIAQDRIFFQLVQRELLNQDEEFKKLVAETVLWHSYSYLQDIFRETKFGPDNPTMPAIVMSILLGYFQIMRFQRHLPVYEETDGAEINVRDVAQEITRIFFD